MSEEDTVQWQKLVGGGTSWYYLLPQRAQSPILAARHERDLTDDEKNLNGKTVREAKQFLEDSDAARDAGREADFVV